MKLNALHKLLVLIGCTITLGLTAGCNVADIVDPTKQQVWFFFENTDRENPIHFDVLNAQGVTIASGDLGAYDSYYATNWQSYLPVGQKVTVKSSFLDGTNKKSVSVTPDGTRNDAETLGGDKVDTYCSRSGKATP